MKYDLIIFDLDGTLLDTLDDLAAAANHALSAFGFPARTRDEVRRFVGNGVAKLIERAVPEGTPDDVCARVLAEFRSFYSGHLDVHTRPYEGITELLEALRAAGIRIAVNSNKPDAASKALIERHFGKLVDRVQGETAGVPKKPAPDGAQAVMAALDATPARTLYVGDGDADLMTAENAGLDCAWVSWGFRTARELAGLKIPRAFDSAQALGDFILESR